MKDRTLMAAAIQMAATPFAAEQNWGTAARLARLAAAQGARVIVLPELFNTGYVYSPRLTASAEPVDGPTVAALLALSAELGAWLGGTLLLRNGRDVFNTFVLAGPAGQLHRYAKRHPFLWEGCYFAAGRAPLIVETDLGRLGLMICWDLTHPSTWADYAGRVDAILLASSPARVHRAVFNFPRGRKVYAAQLLPDLLRQRAVLDELYAGYVGQCAAALGVPVIHSVMAGRFVAQVPLARVSFLGFAAFQPRYWSWASEAHLASMRATFYGTSAIYNEAGTAVAQVDGEAGMALAEVNTQNSGNSRRRLPSPSLPGALRLFEALLRPAAALEYRRHRHAATAEDGRPPFNGPQSP
jgi:predicted amidohydrolase